MGFIPWLEHNIKVMITVMILYCYMIWGFHHSSNLGIKIMIECYDCLSAVNYDGDKFGTLVDLWV